jgi:Na+-translocating ferredoxin:NAD+ oxidoreductase RNF subunit RnfB
MNYLTIFGAFWSSRASVLSWRRHGHRGKVLHVEEDPRIADVEKLLAQWQLRRLRLPGCHGMAEALVNGTVKKCSTCKVGKKDKNFDPIIVYLASHPDPDGTKHVPTL